MHPRARSGRAESRRWRRARAAFWAAVGAAVVLYIFLAALGGIDPEEATWATIAVLVLATAWLAHSWRRLWVEQSLGERPDRDRRRL